RSASILAAILIASAGGAFQAPVRQASQYRDTPATGANALADETVQASPACDGLGAYPSSAASRSSLQWPATHKPRSPAWYNDAVGLRCLLGPEPDRGRSGNRSRSGSSFA